MKSTIICEVPEQGKLSFYLVTEDGRFFLFKQDYRKGVKEYFYRGVSLEQACNYKKTNYDTAIIKTMTKLPAYIKYIEKEYGISVLEQTKKKSLVKSKRDLIYSDKKRDLRRELAYLSC